MMNATTAYGRRRKGARGGGLERARRELSGVKALVVGMAGTGTSVARFLLKCSSVVTATDSKPLSEIPGAGDLAAAGVRVEAGGHPENMLDGVTLVVVSPGVPCDIPLLNEARGRGAEVISEIELAYRYMDCPVLAIAGTNGKSTTTTLLSEVLKAAGKRVFAGGNLGTPAIDFVSSGEEADCAVLEVSSFQLETTDTFNPHIGALLNITEDHLDRYRDFNHYAETKFRLFENQSEKDYAVVNSGDPVIAEMMKKPFTKGAVFPFTTAGEVAEGVFLRGSEVILRLKGRAEAYSIGEFRLRGLHNVENVMAVIAMAAIAGVEGKVVRNVLSAFEGLGHRMEFVRDLDGVAYIDDSKGTNIGSLMMALRGMDTPVVLIAGGRDKGGDYRVLSGLVKEKVKAMVLIGEARFAIKEALGGLTDTVLAGSLEEAVAKARARASRGDTVLLCPACSSFDMFRNYKERGERFRAIVEAL